MHFSYRNSISPTQHTLLESYQKDKSVICVSEGDLVRLFSPHSNTMTELIGSGSDIWNYIDGENTIEDIVSYLMEIYNVEYNVLKKDIKEFINELLSRKMCIKIE